MDKQHVSTACRQAEPFIKSQTPGCDRLADMQAKLERDQGTLEDKAQARKVIGLPLDY